MDKSISADKARELAENARKLGMEGIAEIWDGIADEADAEGTDVIVSELLDVEE